MSDNGRDHFEIPKEIPEHMRSMAQSSFDQARKAFEQFVASTQAAAGRIEERNADVRASAKDISARALTYAEKNVQVSLDYAQSLLKARDLTEIMKLHGDYVQGQMRALTEQASEMGQIISRAAMDAVKPKN
ncbi:phasin family protein [Bradyrhizobium genosp. L]|uniref:phasin family protein n=1 Tax=Bradyrhizobium genosp. L TaxID=83637 RepID=UPI0018A30176|nr:phasin family protein [Bradyrhizobium genosp. L]QPF83997.1 phasin family protein [Bradyrhizobium genosp. L]